MKCPYCGEVDTQVIETRASDDGGSIRRRRRCAGCDKRFTTFERAELRMPLIVKKNGEREEFDSEKLRRSLTLALRKRPVEMAAVETAITRMEEQLLGLAEREVASDALGNMVMDALRGLDHVAYVRFASVYRNFADVDEFSRAVREVSPGRRRR